MLKSMLNRVISCILGPESERTPDPARHWQREGVWNNDTRVLPEPVLVDHFGNTWLHLRIDLLGPDSSYRDELTTEPKSGLGSQLYHVYHVLGYKRALEYMVQNGLQLVEDRSTGSQIDMLVVRPANLVQPLTVRRRHVPHQVQECGAPCFLCGSPFDQCRQHVDCPAMLHAMGLEHEPVA